MEDTPESPKSPAAPAAAAARSRKKAAARKTGGKAAARPGSSPSLGSAPTRSVKTARKKPAVRKTAKKSESNVEQILASLASSASRAGASLTALSEDSVRTARRAWTRTGTASKSTIKRVMREWKSLEPKRRTQYVAALLGALAAASAPLVRAKLKKR